MVIYVELDENNAVLGWSSSYSEGLTEVEIPEDHPIVVLNDFFGNYVFKDDKLIKDPSKELANLKEYVKDTLADSCYQETLKGFDYPFSDSETYHVSYSKNKQQYFEEIKSLFERKVVTHINWEFINADGGTILKELDEISFLTLYTFASLVKTAKMNKLKEKLYPLVDSQIDKDEDRKSVV